LASGLRWLRGCNDIGDVMTQTCHEVDLAGVATCLISC
jgi:hypothetical protein